MTEKEQLARIVNGNRASLIKQFMYHFDGTTAQASEFLTKRAINSEYVAVRSAPPGEALKSWSIKNESPQWACRAAFDYLIDTGWSPSTDTDKAITARYLLLNHHAITPSWVEVLGSWLDMAVRANEEN